MSKSFDKMCLDFTSLVNCAAGWKDNYLGAAYATRIKAAITDLKHAIRIAEQNEEIAPGQPAQPQPGDGAVLLPCPFCGGGASRSEGRRGDGKSWHYIECLECAASAEPTIWNTRHGAGWRSIVTQDGTAMLS